MYNFMYNCTCTCMYIIIVEAFLYVVIPTVIHNNFYYGHDLIIYVV